MASLGTQRLHAQDVGDDDRGIGRRRKSLERAERVRQMKEDRAEHRDVEASQIAGGSIDVGVNGGSFESELSFGKPPAVSQLLHRAPCAGGEFVHVIDLRERHQFRSGAERQIEDDQIGAFRSEIGGQKTACRPDFEHALSADVAAAKIGLLVVAQVPGAFTKHAVAKIYRVIENGVLFRDLGVIVF